jgi:hypothetical protein
MCLSISVGNVSREVEHCIIGTGARRPLDERDARPSR